MKSKLFLPLGLVVCFLLGISPFIESPAHAECVFTRTKQGYSIICTGVTTGSLSGTSKNDSILVTTGAELISTKTGTGSAPSKVTAFGIDGGKGNDVIRNDGTIRVETSTDTDSTSVTAIGIIGGNGKDTITNSGTMTVTASFPRTNATAVLALPEIGTLGKKREEIPGMPSVTAVGIQGGNDKGKIHNDGSLTVEASSILNSVGNSATLSGGDEVSATTTVSTSALGIDGGTGKDDIGNAGILAVTATSEVNSINTELNLADTSHGDTSTYIRSSSTGIHAGNGKDTITVGNAGTITAEAFSRSRSASMEVNGVDAATGDSKLEVRSTSVGIDGGRSKDSIANSGTVKASSSSEVLEVGVNASFVDVTIADRQGSDISTTLWSTATGIDTSQGKDDLTISQTGAVVATATSKVNSTGVSIASEGVPGSTETLFRDAGLSAIGITSNSNAAGITGGTGKDRVNSVGAITANATSTSTQKSINVGVAIFDFKLPTPGIVLGGAGTAAFGSAVGICTGHGNDEIASAGPVDVDANATASATTVSVNIAELSADLLPGVPGIPFGASLVVSDTSTVATAEGTGIDGGKGNDTIKNTGAVETNATATSGSTSASATLNVKFKEGDNFLAADAIFARAVTDAKSCAEGIDGGDGKDTIVNEGTVSVGAEANASTIAVGVNVAGTIQGKGGALGLAATDTSSSATAGATGIQGGAENDEIVNAGSVAVTSIADVDSASASLEVGIAKQGVVAGAALSRSESNATATAIGIDGGTGKDEIRNTGTIGLQTRADADAVSVSLTVEGTAKGLAAGAAITDASVNATSDAAGIKGGSGDDRVVNTGKITSTGLTATSTAVGVSPSVLLAKEGAALGAALADTSATAVNDAAGIDGGHGDDEVVNTGSVSLHQVKANADAVSVSLEVALAKEGLAAGAALAGSGSTGKTSVRGLDGGLGDDRLENDGVIRLHDIGADADAVSVSVGIAGAKDGVALDAVLVNAGALAEATAVGISGGDGEDELVNRKEISVDNLKANSDAVGVSVGFSFAKGGVAIDAALADTAAKAKSRAIGLDGGDDEDRVINEGSVTLSNVGAEADAVSVSVGRAVALDGVAISAGLTDASGTADAAATGLAGGGGDDILVNLGTITEEIIRADAHATGVSVQLAGVSGGVAGGVTIADTSATANAAATGLDGGAGDDTLVNADQIALRGIGAHADAVSATVTLNAALKAGVAAGAAMSDASATAITNAVGMAGGDGDDRIVNKGTITADGITADTDADSVSVELGVTSTGVAIGAALADSSATAIASAVGLDGGAGDDHLVNAGSILLENVTSDADVVSVGVSLNAAIKGGVAAGVALTDASGKAEVVARGMSGGDGDDMVINTGTIRTDNVVANADATGVSVSLSASMEGLAAGAAVADTSVTASADVDGLAGGAGDDFLYNSGTVDVAGKSKADAFGLGIQISAALGVAAGASITDASSTARTEVTGIDGGPGFDEILNEGTVKATADAEADSTTISVGVTIGVGGAVTLADARSTATATAVGIHDTGGMGGDGKDDSDDRGRRDDDDDDDRNGKKKRDDDDRDDGPINLLANRGDVTANAISRSVGIAVSGSLFGFSLGETTNTSTAIATGIGAEDGRYVIRNEGKISAGSAATAEGLAVAVTFAGAALGDATSTANSLATGIDTGARDDRIENLDEILVDARSFAGATSVSVGLAGLIQADASTTSNAVASGIRSGAGNDAIVNRSSITVAAGVPELRDGSGSCTPAAGGACAKSSTVSVTLLGSGKADAATAANAHATGMDGGTGDDDIGNEGGITVGALARGRSVGTGVTLLGASEANAAGTTNAFAAGLSGGAGFDRIGNSGTIGVHAASETFAKSTAVTLVGGAKSEGNTLTIARAFGIHGGDHDDAIANHESGVVRVRATTGSTVSGSSWNFAGGAASEATLGAFTLSTGIAGGGGSDRILNLGFLDVGTASALSVTGGGKAIFGEAGAGSKVTADSFSTGIDGGEDNDVIDNLGRIDVRSHANLYSRATSFSLVGGAATSEVLTAKSFSAGIDGGDGENSIGNRGEIAVIATSVLLANGGASSILSGSEVAATVAADTAATGIRTGWGKDLLLNDEGGTVSVTVSANPKADNDAAGGAFWADGVTRSDASSAATAHGIDAGGNGDQVVNKGKVSVVLIGTAEARGLSDPDLLSSIFGIDADAFAYSTVWWNPSEAIGILAKGGDNLLFNAGDVTVAAAPRSYAYADANGEAIISGDGTAQATSRADDISSAGMLAGVGVNRLHNRGTVTVSAGPIADAYAVSDADGIGEFREPDSKATATVSADRAFAAGIRAEGGENEIVNEGIVSVTIEPRADKAHAYAHYGGDILGIDAFATATATANDGRAFGILADGDANFVWNREHAVISVASSPSAIADASASGVGLDGDASPLAFAHADRALAVGISAGGGESEIRNDGEIQVRTVAQAYAQAIASPSASGEVEDFAEVATARNALAIGIWSRGTENHVDNRGRILVDSMAVAGLHTPFGPARSDSRAIGISAGEGKNEVGNSGEIRVVADASSAPVHFLFGISNASATAIGIEGGSGGNHIVNSGRIDVLGIAAGSTLANASAFGIRTGGGADTIVHKGIIAATTVADGTERAGIGISTGGGNDRVVLGDRSVVEGSIDLGDGDDELTVIGSATVSGNSYGGAGYDDLILDGATDFSLNRVFQFEEITKKGWNQVDMNDFLTIDHLEMAEGKLKINSHYRFADAGTFRSRVHSSGGFGQLKIDGNVQVAGKMIVERGRGFYSNGKSYDVIVADTLTGDFDAVTVPDPTPLLSFQASRKEDRYQVTTAAREFTTVATNRAEHAVAQLLDTVTPKATGDFLEMMGEFQALSSSEYKTAFTSLGPAAHDSATNTTRDMAARYSKTLMKRIHSIRTRHDGSGGSASGKATSGNRHPRIAYTGSDAGMLRLADSLQPARKETTYGFWVSGFGQWGDQEATPGFAGYDYRMWGNALGFDHAFGERLLGGISIAYADMDLDLDGNLGSHDVGGIFTSLYGSYFTRRFYLDAALSHGRQSFDSIRNITVGGVQSTARGDHDGDLWSAYAEGGCNVGSRTALLQPFASLHYVALQEDGFTETGAGSLNMTIGDRKSNSLTSELGLRATRIMTLKSGRLIPEISAAWKYDLAVDDRIITASFADFPGDAFSLPGQEIERNGGVLGAGITFLGNHGFTASLQYNLESREDYLAQGLMGEFRYEF